MKDLPKDEQYGSETDARQVFDRLAGTWTYWGWKGGYFASEDDALAFRDELAYMLATQRVAPNSPAVVQHRPALGLWHRRSRPGPFLCRPLHRQAGEVQVVLRASAAACLLHPVRRRRPRQRRRHHGPVGARSPPVQIRLRHRLQLLLSARRRRKALRRRQVARA